MLVNERVNMVNEKKLELIDELKALREEKGITYQEIADRTAASGTPSRSPPSNMYSTTAIITTMTITMC